MNAVEPSDPGLHAGDLDTLLRRLLGRLGHTLNRWSLREAEQTGTDTTLLIEAHVHTGRGAETERHLGLTTAVLAPGTAAATETLKGQGWSLWLHPHDPRLPGLARAVDPEHLRSLAGGAPVLALRMISYRPLRRAVLRADLGATTSTPARSIYLKVLPEDLAEPTVTRHRILAEAGVPVPTVLEPPVLGVLPLAGVSGRSLAARLMRGRARPEDAEEILQVLDRLPEAALELPPRPGWAARAVDFAPRLQQLLPDHRHRWGEVLDQVELGLDHETDGAVVPVHGDLYEAHLLFEGSRVTGVLDVDGLGPGQRIDDVACLLGHLAVLPTVDRRYRGAAPVLQRLSARLAASIVGGVAGDDLRRRTAAVVLTLMPTGPVLHGNARADLARQHARDLGLQRLRFAEDLVGVR